MAKTKGGDARGGGGGGGGEAPFHPHALSTDQVLRHFGVDANRGLTAQQVEESRARYGRNEVEHEAGTPFWRLVLEQFDDLLVKILLAAAVVSLGLAFLEDGDAKSRLTAFVEPVVIMLILIANAIVGVVQESNAEKAIEALKQYEPETAVALRDGKLATITAAELVPGDIIEVAVGDRIPADARVLALKSVTFRVDQSILTGESHTVTKDAEVVDDPAGRCVNQDKLNIVFAGTNVGVGACRAIVTGTGLRTEIGVIRKDLADLDDTVSPLKQKLDAFAEQLSKVISVICLVVFAMNVSHFGEIEGGFISGAIYYLKISVSLAVAAIPEGLPAVVTTCLALGTMKMAKKNAIVRSLPSVETLGCTTVICSDKTGTLTTNKMAVQRVVVAETTTSVAVLPVSGISYDPRDGGVEGLAASGAAAGTAKATTLNASLEEVALVCAMCNGSEIVYNSDADTYDKIGEPTEVALKVLAEKIGVPSLPATDAEAGEATLRGASKEARTKACSTYWSRRYEKLATLEFDRDRKSMSVLCQDRSAKTHVLFVKGAPESVLERCTKVRLNRDGSEAKLTPKLRESLLAELEAMTSRALRVLACAVVQAKPLKAYDLSSPTNFVNYEQDMTFVGLCGMQDPPRVQVPGAVAKCHTAGIRVIVITGDNKATAESVCRTIGVFAPGEDLTGKSYTGREFSDMTEHEQLAAVGRANLFSRTEPSHKSRLVDLLKSTGAVVAMTGDGVNDAPALKKADIGIAMGTGTAVAKAASDMVLADDNFATIVCAIEEGRAIYANTKQFIRYLISSNIGEVVSIFVTFVVGIPEALIPVQLLWVNLVTDGLPATALGFNPPDPDIMSTKPRGRDDPIINGWLFVRYLVIGIYIGLATVASFAYWFVAFEGGPKMTWAQLRDYHSCVGTACDIYHHNTPSSISLSVLVVVEMMNAINSLSDLGSLLVVPVWSNGYLLIAITISMLLHFTILYVPFLAEIFNVAALGWAEWKIVLAFSAPVVLIDEVLKLTTRVLKL